MDEHECWEAAAFCLRMSDDALTIENKHGWLELAHEWAKQAHHVAATEPRPGSNLRH